MRADLRMILPIRGFYRSARWKSARRSPRRVFGNRDGADEPPRDGRLLPVKRAGACTPEVGFKNAGYGSTQEDRALSRKSKVSCSILLGRRALAGERGNESATPNFGSPTTRLRPTRGANLSLEECSDEVLMRSRTVRIAIGVRRAPTAATPAIGQATPLEGP
jgi:hypothetical protein